MHTQKKSIIYTPESHMYTVHDLLIYVCNNHMTTFD